MQFCSWILIVLYLQLSQKNSHCAIYKRRFDWGERDLNWHAHKKTILKITQPINFSLKLTVTKLHTGSFKQKKKLTLVTFEKKIMYNFYYTNSKKMLNIYLF